MLDGQAGCGLLRGLPAALRQVVSFLTYPRYERLATVRRFAVVPHLIADIRCTGKMTILVAAG